MERFRKYFWRFTLKDAPKADELLNLCKEKIQILSAQHLSSSSENYLINEHQCKFLVGRLTDTKGILQSVQLSPLLDEKTIPVLEELHQLLLKVETIISASHITTSQWPRAAIEQNEMKETFSRLLYDVQWHTSVLLSILVDNSGESYITFEPTLCGGKLSVGDEFALLTAMKEDDESLKERLRSTNQDDPTGKRLANQLLKLKMRSEEEQLQKSYQSLENREAKELSVVEASTDNSLVTSFPELLFLDPQDVDLDGDKIGAGASATVKKTNLLGGNYAVKIFNMLKTDAFDQEMAALQGLGHHPHIVRLLCYSKDDDECYLIMEKMDKDLQAVLANVARDRKRGNLPPRGPFTDVQAVTLMLQIGEGMTYIHSMGMAHRDLKSGNILVNLVNPSGKSSSEIRSVKIADFGLTKTKNATRTNTQQSLNTGTTMWMAPEVIGEVGDVAKYRFNPRKADVYSFAIVCVEILTGKYPYHDTDLSSNVIKEQVKAGTRRPNLPQECPQRLVTLITRCWHPISHERPLFPEICRELRYIKGLLLRGDKKALESQGDLPLRSFTKAQILGPWGGVGGNRFSDIGSSINRIKLKYSQSPGFIGSMEVEYNVLGMKVVRIYCDNYNGNLEEEIPFELFEFITHISGYVSETLLRTTEDKTVPFDNVVALTIHTNIRSYGPFGEEKGKPFASKEGRVVGFHGGGGAILDSLGVVVNLGDTS